MTESIDAGRVAVYIDFDNVVISRYDQLHGQGAWRRDRARDAAPAVLEKLAAARIDVGEIVDFASSFGTVALTRAYADWSVPANAAYRGQLVDRAVDLTQMFPASGTKNGADIRLAVDVLEDLFRLPDIDHVVIVAGDSDYVSLAQRCKRLGRFVVAVGVAGSTSTVLVSACDAFEYYDDILSDADDVDDDASDDGVRGVGGVSDDAADPHTGRSRSHGDVYGAEFESADDDLDGDFVGAEDDEPADSGGAPAAPRRVTWMLNGRLGAGRGSAASDESGTAAGGPAGQPIGRPGAGRLLIKALGLVAKDDDGWSVASAVKGQMKRLNPQFAEKSLGFSSFTEFVKSRLGQVELREDGQQRYLRLRTTPAEQ